MLGPEPGNQLDGIPAIISTLEDSIWNRDSASHRGSPCCWRQSCWPACPAPRLSLCSPKWAARGGRASLSLAAGHSPSPLPLFKRSWDSSRPLSPSARIPHSHRVPHSRSPPLLSLTLGKRVPYLNKDALRNHPRAEGCSELPVPSHGPGVRVSSAPCVPSRCPLGASPAPRCAGLSRRLPPGLARPLISTLVPSVPPCAPVSPGPS